MVTSGGRDGAGTRDALLRSTRFSQFQRSLGIPREILTARLASLVESDVLERSSYKPEGGRARDEHQLTEAGRDLSVVLLATRSPPARLTADHRLRRRPSWSAGLRPARRPAGR